MARFRPQNAAERLLGFLPAGSIRRAIRRHRRWRTTLGRFSIQQSADRRSLFIAIAMAGAAFAERMARGRLIRHPPQDAGEAQEKLLYLMSLSIGADIDFSAAELRQIKKTLQEFQAELRLLLRMKCLEDTVAQPQGGMDGRRQSL